MKRERYALAFAILIALAGQIMAKEAESGKADEKAMIAERSITIRSSKDGSDQKALFYCPPSAAPDAPGEPVPLLVTLHSWSTNHGACAKYLAPAQQRQWIMVAPDFRGSNNKPDACASELAIQDVLDAVGYAMKHGRVDTSRIYLIGGSGGGHMALMMAGKAPELWAGVSAWVPISDIEAWHGESRERKNNYAKMIEAVCGGPPNAATAAQYRARSPITFLARAKGLALDINAGIHDGHTGSVPISHSLHAFNELARSAGAGARSVAPADIRFMVEKERIPEALAAEKALDPERDRAVLFRREAGSARISIFEGGHQEDMHAGLAWLGRQRKGRPADFSVPANGSAALRHQDGTQDVTK